MRKARFILALIAIVMLISFTAIGAKSGAGTSSVNYTAPKIQTAEQKLETLNDRHEKAKFEFNKENSKDQKKIDEQNKKLQQIEKEKEELKRQVQAKAAERNKLNASAENALNVITATQTAHAEQLDVKMPTIGAPAEKPAEAPAPAPNAYNPNNCNTDTQWIREDNRQCKDKPVAEASAPVAVAAAPAPVASNIGSTPQEWMAAAGIPQSDWVYVDCVINGCQGVSAEGGWGGTTRWNTTGSGAYGLCQALPASKMASAGADWETNPVTQLRWCNDYAQAYGGWAQAWNFRKCVGSCYSPRTNTTVSKDHTWW